MKINLTMNGKEIESTEEANIDILLPNLSLGKPSIASLKYSMDFDVNTSDRRIKVSDILTPSQLDKLIELQPNAVTQIIEAHYRNTPSNTIKP